ncbi:hypothetical protein ADIAG_00223 [Paeniglutamicibacter gangotriensis Lz1y]|uniref:Uncharacterized protein n=1 Tax=Paeniglutamicibacter gangotriensis Lz1y TaxID=1276920 RepID=M7MZ41_9MICC|nr:hypothetical protein ADIAG_00223 [Paeniglutamicibacter gangotriensis Lz1y]
MGGTAAHRQRPLACLPERENQYVADHTLLGAKSQTAGQDETPVTTTGQTVC